MQALDILKNEHRMIDDLLAAIQKMPDPSTRRELILQVGIVLGDHRELEERALYPVCSRYANLRALVERSLESHELIADLIVQLREKPSLDALDQLFDQLVVLVERHIDDEQTELLPLAAETLDDRTMNELATRFEQAVAAKNTAKKQAA